MKAWLNYDGQLDQGKIESAPVQFLLHARYHGHNYGCACHGCLWARRAIAYPVEYLEAQGGGESIVAHTEDNSLPSTQLPLGEQQSLHDISDRTINDLSVG